MRFEPSRRERLMPGNKLPAARPLRPHERHQHQTREIEGFHKCWLDDKGVILAPAVSSTPGLVMPPGIEQFEFHATTMSSSSGRRPVLMADRNLHEIDVILYRHDEAFRAFGEASKAFDAAVGALRDTLNAIQAANHAQAEAMRLLRETNG